MTLLLWCVSLLNPIAERPHMPGYGTLPPDEGSGLLPWSWAEEQLNENKNFWVATNGNDGQPHLSPVWAVWDGESLTFSCATTSRKARNLELNLRCTVATESAMNPVIIEGNAELILDMPARLRMLAGMNQKYQAEIPDDFMALDRNSVFSVAPIRAFGLQHDDFSGSPTRWTFNG